MKKPSDKQLGMQRAITRRDFVQGAAVAAGTALQAGALASSGVANASATFQRRRAAHDNGRLPTG